MPTTLTGLLVFVVLLMPGFAYVVGKERAAGERRVSAFRETVSVAAASILSNVATLMVLVISWTITPTTATFSKGWLVALWAREPTGVPDVESLLTDPEGYWQRHPLLVLVWSFAALALSTITAYVAASPGVRTAVFNIPSRMLAAVGLESTAERTKVHVRQHESTVSAWSMVFEQHRDDICRETGQDPEIAVCCKLDDGSYVSGKLAFWNSSADDSADRDITLAEPLKHRWPEDMESEPLEGQIAIISSRHIVALTANFHIRSQTQSPSHLPAEVRDGLQGAVSEVGEPQKVPL
jgi:Family of unknown function (DUF6338)